MADESWCKLDTESWESREPEETQNTSKHNFGDTAITKGIEPVAPDAEEGMVKGGKDKSPASPKELPGSMLPSMDGNDHIESKSSDEAGWRHSEPALGPNKESTP